MADDAVHYWIAQAKRVPLLTPDEELHLGALVRRWQDHPKGQVADEENPDLEHRIIIRRGRRARDRIVAANLRMVASFVQNRRHDGPLEDRLQNGVEGLIKAANKFDPTRGYKFSTYAFFWLRATVDKGEADENLIGLPINVNAAVRGKTNGPCSPDRLAAGKAARFVYSLDRTFSGDDNTTLGDLIAAPSTDPDPDVADLYERIETLDPIQQRLVLGHWGDPPMSYARLAVQEAISVGEVRRMIDQALHRLRQKALPPALTTPTLTPWQPVECCQLSLSLSTQTPPVAP
jgi:DNA-directed RNA polymerase sigma subunit (sigma70/sigma32)